MQLKRDLLGGTIATMVALSLLILKSWLMAVGGFFFSVITVGAVESYIDSRTEKDKLVKIRTVYTAIFCAVGAIAVLVIMIFNW